jgi:PAS domain S-box-containing protein
VAIRIGPTARNALAVWGGVCLLVTELPRGARSRHVSGGCGCLPYPAAVAIGKHISLVIPPERIDEEEWIIATLKAGRRIDHFETERARADGTAIRVSLTISPIVDETGAVLAASRILRGVSARKYAEAERQRLLKVLEDSPDFIGICDLQGVPFFVNRAGLQMVGLDTFEQATHTPVAEFFFPEDQARIINECFPQVLRDTQGEIDIRFRHFKTSAARWMAYKVLTLTDVPPA